jgi:hypothetical protein
MAHKTTLGKGHVTERGITLKLETQEDVEQFVQSLTSLAAEVSVGRLRIYAVPAEGFGGRDDGQLRRRPGRAPARRAFRVGP